MSQLLTSAQMKQLEQGAICAGEVTGQALMERAGQGVVDAMRARWPDMGKAVVLCGPGNNGGDGFVIARLLKQQFCEVSVLFAGEASGLPDDARVNYDRWLPLGGVQPLDEASLAMNLSAESIVVDALFGAGLNRPVEGGAKRALAALAGYRKAPLPHRAIVAVDGPSGLCLDSGRPLQSGVGVAGAYVPKADLSLTFQALKTGHLLAQGPEHCGEVRVVDIGLARRLAEMSHISTDQGRAIARLTLPPICAPDHVSPALGVNLGKTAGQHKFHHGHLLVVSGPSGQTGAARLAARAALRVGAGLVTVAAPRAALAEHAAQLTAIMLKEVNTGAELAEVLDDKRINAVCIGPALGLDAHAEALLEAVLSSRKPVVLDADALTLLARRKALRALLHGGCVLTPHEGEFARLFPALAKAMKGLTPKGPAFSKLDAARQAAADLGVGVVFKGADTVIAQATGFAQIHSSTGLQAAPWLATAGSGDVLAGLIAGLLARRINRSDAEGAAVWLHAEAARSFGPGLIAEDLPERVPKVLAALQSGV